MVDRVQKDKDAAYYKGYVRRASELKTRQAERIDKLGLQIVVANCFGDEVRVRGQG
jgi:hypothetical protein